jgi:hypothetical protein
MYINILLNIKYYKFYVNETDIINKLDFKK